MSDPEEMLALNEVTGLVHNYEGTIPGGLGAEEHDVPIGIAPCGCELFEEAVANDNLKVINRKHLEAGIWEPADCMGGDD